MTSVSRGETSGADPGKNTSAEAGAAAIEDLISKRRIVICCGSGGVGKTTTAAVLALEGARRGRNACVVTIDPAKRLASALGLEALTGDASEIDPRAGTAAKTPNRAAASLR